MSSNWYEHELLSNRPQMGITFCCRPPPKPPAPGDNLWLAHPPPSATLIILFAINV